MKSGSLDLLALHLYSIDTARSVCVCVCVCVCKYTTVNYYINNKRQYEDNSLRQ